MKTPTLAFTHKEWNMEEGICFVNLAVVRAVCIIQKVRGTIIVVIIERDKMYKKQKKKKRMNGHTLRWARSVTLAVASTVNQ